MSCNQKQHFITAISCFIFEAVSGGDWKEGGLYHTFNPQPVGYG